MIKSTSMPEPPQHGSYANRSLPSLGWLAMRCIIAVAVSVSVTIFIAAGLEYFFNRADASFGQILDEWLGSGDRFTGPWGRLIATAVGFTPVCAVAVLLAVDRLRWREPDAANRLRFNWKLWLAGLSSSAVVWMLALVILDLTVRQNSVVQRTIWNSEVAESWPIFAALSLVVVGAFAFAEELIFRGFLPKLFQGIGIRPIIAIALSTVLFVIAHDLTSPVRVLQLILAAGAFAWSVHRLGSIEFAAGAHMALNLGINTWHTRSVELKPGGDPSFLAGYSVFEWAVLLVMALAPAVLCEAFVRFNKTESISRRA